ncbi:MAG: ECF-type sigma factor [Pirellulales bacterium]
MEHSVSDVSRWIEDLRSGSEQAADDLWKYYQRRLRFIAFRRLRRFPGAVVDDEDIALSAFRSFVRRHQEGCFPGIERRDDMWRMLVVIAVRKSINEIRRSRCLRRHPGPTAGVAVQSLDSDTADPHPSPETQVMINESIGHLLNQLPDEELREIAMAKTAGYTNTEIAVALGRSLATVERRLQLIRRIWQRQVDE